MLERLAGRDAECAALRGQLTAAAAPTAATTAAAGVPALAAGVASPLILVAGEAGAGKTTLVEHVLAGAALPTLRGRATEWAGPAYDPIARALRPVIGHAVTDVPELLTQVLPERGEPPPDRGPTALAAALRAVLAQAAGGRPLVLFLDDLQWADEATLGLLPALADAIGALPVALVGCYRNDELARGHGLRAVRALLRRGRQLSEIELGPLADADVTRMLAGLWGVTPQPALAAVVASRADGLPFAVEELAFALRDSGRLDFRDGTVALAGAGAAPIPDGIREAVLLQVARLTEPQRALLETAAVAGNEFDADIVLAASGLPAWPDAFTGSGLLTEVSNGRAAFRHALTREAAYADIPWSRRRHLHRELAAVLARGPAAAPALIAVHLLAARDFGPARKALIAAADQYWAVHAYRDAARVLRTALEHWPFAPEQDALAPEQASPGRVAPETGDDGRLAVIDRLARCAERCSDYAEATTLLRELADAQEKRGDARALALAHRRLALVHELRGQWEPALTAREAAAVAFAAAGLPAEAATDRLAVATHLRAAASYSAALVTLRAVQADADASGHADLRLRAEGLRGNVLSRLGRPAEGIAALRSALDQALVQSLPDTAGELQQRLADAIEHSGDYRAATAAYAAAFQFCEARGADAVGQLCRACATVVLFACGEWDRAALVCEDVLAGEVMPHTRAAAAAIGGLVHAMRGSPKLARPLLLESGLIAVRIELTAAELISAWGLCVLEDAAGELAQAADRARQILARRARTQERHYSVPILQWTATFFTERGLAGDTLACAEALAEVAEATAQPEATAALAHARGETLLADDPQAALRELNRAAEMFGQLGIPLSAAQAQRRAAAAALRLGEHASARELLRSACDTAGRLGARPMRASCATALTQLGGKPAAPDRPQRRTAGLTRRELDVMLLVARGNTTKQIGTSLFISPRTVEMHVQGSLLKLGCRTRADAVRRLAELDALPAPGGAEGAGAATRT